MNEVISKVANGLIRQPIFNFPFEIAWRRILYKLGILLTGAIFIFLLILLKSKTTAQFSVEPSFFTYSIFVTAFVISRLISATMYENSFGSLVNGNTKNGNSNSLDYEPKVAFVIPCKNEEKDIVDSIIQCYQIRYPREKLEVIAINDGSTDRTHIVLEELRKFYPDLKIIHWNENQGKRWGMAAGFRVSSADIIIQLDSDSQVDPDTFYELIRPFKNPNVGAVCAYGEPKNADQNIITKMQAAYYFMSFRILKAAESTFDTVFCCSGCCSAYRKSAVMPVLYNWLSESFLGQAVTWGDDRALTSWIIKDGWKTVYNDNARAFTVVPDSWKKLLKQQLRWKKSWIVNSLFTSSFIFKKQTFVAFFYYFPLVLISFITPIMTFRALFWFPITKGTFPLFHILGVMLITSLIVIFYRYKEPENKYWPYLFLWSLFNFFILSFMIVWAAIRIQDRRWGTR